MNVPTTQSLAISLADSTSTDVNQIYAQLGTPPTPGNYQYSVLGRRSQSAVAHPLGGARHVVHPGVLEVGADAERVLDDR